MIRYLTHPDGLFWRAQAIDDAVEIRHGSIGEPGTVLLVDTYEELGTPPEYSLDDMAGDMYDADYVDAPIPDVHLEIEKAHDVTLPPVVRDFYANRTYLDVQFKRCQSLGCEVDFVSDAVLGLYSQVHYDAEREADRTFVPISARIYDGYEDEQQWIGIDPADETTIVYALYTSGDFDVAYPTFDAFLADLVDADDDE